MEALNKHYPWVERQGFKFFMSRLEQLYEANETTLSIVLKYCASKEMEERAIPSAIYTCEVVWALHDAIYMSYVIEGRPLSLNLTSWPELVDP